ncbi:uncharacterized protein TNCV_1245651 [Trichonephila clavipes]|uniref:Uncharacterized protein n=1 Tax=Trichonephila clavipes TaxID=2585209 RepID=A0A8X6RBP9_TRICX|nr:uncharacterized protein TNCV_1245651 [Trichonephila clavipes]
MSDKEPDVATQPSVASGAVTFLCSRELWEKADRESIYFLMDSCGRVSKYQSKYVTVSISDPPRVSELILASHCSATRGLLATDHVILNHDQVTWTTPELAPSLLTTTPHQREDVSALDRFNVHRYPTRWVFSGTGLELMTYLP